MRNKQIPEEVALDWYKNKADGLYMSDLDMLESFAKYLFKAYVAPQQGSAEETIINSGGGSQANPTEDRSGIASLNPSAAILSSLTEQLNELISDEDLTDEKLVEASEGLLPNLACQLNNLLKNRHTYLSLLPKPQPSGEAGAVERIGTASEFIDRAVAMLKEQYEDKWLVAGYNGIVSLLSYAKTKINRMDAENKELDEHLGRRLDDVEKLQSQLAQLRQENERLNKLVNNMRC